jgi:hypothetical protein
MVIVFLGLRVDRLEEGLIETRANITAIVSISAVALFRELRCSDRPRLIFVRYRDPMEDGIVSIYFVLAVAFSG